MAHQTDNVHNDDSNDGNPKANEFIDTVTEYLSVGQLPRVSREDPERIRVDSVIETSDCLCVLCSLSANFLIFPSFIVLFLYSTVQKSAVQYSIRPPGRSER